MTTSGQITCTTCGLPIDGEGEFRCDCVVLKLNGGHRRVRFHCGGKFRGPIEIAEQPRATCSLPIPAVECPPSGTRATGGSREIGEPPLLDRDWLWWVFYGACVLVCLAALVALVMVFAP